MYCYGTSLTRAESTGEEEEVRPGLKISPVDPPATARHRPSAPHPSFSSEVTASLHHWFPSRSQELTIRTMASPNVNMDAVEALHVALQQSFSPDASIRDPAEASIKHLKFVPGATQMLLHITEEKQVSCLLLCKWFVLMT